jgi:effector-binding domain-containing protein
VTVDSPRTIPRSHDLTNQLTASQMIDTPAITTTAEQPTAVIHLTIPRSEIQNEMGPAHQELFATLAAQGITPTGPWFSHHFRMDPAVWDFEVGVPVKSPVKPTGRVASSRLPAGRVARTVYRGGYEGLGAAWGELETWMKDTGLEPAPELWEIYAAGPESGSDPAGWRTELNRPIAD